MRAMPRNISDRLAEMARLQPNRPAVIAGGRSVTFKELDDDVSRLASGFIGERLCSGARVALMVPPGVDFVAITFALFRAGAVPVLIDPGIGFTSLGRCLDEAAPEFFIGVLKAHVGRWLGGWGKKSLKRSFFSGNLPRADPGPVARLEGETAAILFTSGSTGAPKGAVYTHAIFNAQADLLRDHFGVAPGDVSVPTFPLFALFDVALGMTAVIPEMDATRPGFVDPLRIIEPIKRHGAVQLFGSPALLDRISRYGEARGVTLPSVKRVISAGAPVPAKVVERVLRMLGPEARVHTPYGATEALPVACWESGPEHRQAAQLTAEGKGLCVGSAMPGMRVRIIRITDESIERWSDELLVQDGTIGEIVVQGPVVSAEYFARRDATRFAKISGPSGEVLHRMGDLGYRDAQGRLWFCGRKSQRVVTAQGESFTIPCEGVFNAHPKVRRSALVGVGRNPKTPVLCVEVEAACDERQLEKELLELAGRRPHTRGIKKILFHPRFPVDIRHNAKIFRERLAVWAEALLRGKGLD